MHALRRTWQQLLMGSSDMLPQQEAAREKARAGEGRDVEHVALETEGTLQLAAAKGAAAPRRSARRGGKVQGGDTSGVCCCADLTSPGFKVNLGWPSCLTMSVCCIERSAMWHGCCMLCTCMH